MHSLETVLVNKIKSNRVAAMMTSQLAYLMCTSVLGLHSVEFPPPLALGTNTFDQAEIIMNSTVLLVCQAMTN